MPNLFDRGAQWLAGALQAQASVPITYVRGGTSKTFAATRGQTQIEQVDANGLSVLGQTCDYLFPPALLAELGDPQPYDRIRDAGAGVEVEVQNIGAGECFRPCDASRRLIRVHGQRLGPWPTP